MTKRLQPIHGQYPLLSCVSIFAKPKFKLFNSIIRLFVYKYPPRVHIFSSIPILMFSFSKNVHTSHTLPLLLLPTQKKKEREKNSLFVFTFSNYLSD